MREIAGFVRQKVVEYTRVGALIGVAAFPVQNVETTSIQGSPGSPVRPITRQAVLPPRDLKQGNEDEGEREPDGNGSRDRLPNNRPLRGPRPPLDGRFR